MRIAFEALIKKYTPITLQSGDKQVALELQLNDTAITEETLHALSSLYMKTPKRVMVVLMESEDVKRS